MSYHRILLVLTSPLGQIVPKFSNYLSDIQTKNPQILYVHLLPQHSNENNRHLAAWNNTVTSLYQQGSILCSNLDLRVLLHESSVDVIPRPIHEIYFEDDVIQGIQQPYLQNFQNSKVSKLKKEVATSENVVIEQVEVKNYNNVCLGGTFDRIHNGHKILLSEAALRCNEKLTVGVTDETMLKSKKVADLIEDTKIRIDVVKTFLDEIRGKEGENFVTPISDPFGPAITDSTLSCIVGSDETKRGCEKINEIRSEKGFQPLDVHLIKLVDDSCHEVVQLEETKISSSNRRIRLLGEEIRTPHKPDSVPYIIGLTGGSCSGKSNIARYLEDIGAGIIDCDKLGHLAYEPGTECYSKILETFGQDLKMENGNIDRKKLGGKVFSSPESLHKLESIVWPEILKLALEKTENLHQQGKKIIIWDAAVLLTAEWNKHVHEVWGAFIDRQEAIKRIVERDGKTEEQAIARLDNQMSNKELISKCNTVFYSLWDYEITRKQVVKAWNRVQEKIP